MNSWDIYPLIPISYQPSLNQWSETRAQFCLGTPCGIWRSSSSSMCWFSWSVWRSICQRCRFSLLDGQQYPQTFSNADRRTWVLDIFQYCCLWKKKQSPTGLVCWNFSVFLVVSFWFQVISASSVDDLMSHWVKLLISGKYPKSYGRKGEGRHAWRSRTCFRVIQRISSATNLHKSAVMVYQIHSLYLLYFYFSIKLKHEY